MSEPQYNDTDIAICAMSCRFPGADDPDRFWENLRNGVESILPVAAEELAAAGIDEAILKHPDFLAVRAAMDGIPDFDARFFGYTPSEAELIDPQHRLFLECAWHALEAAAYDPARYSGRIGIFAGCGMNTYLLFNLMADRSRLAGLNAHQIMIASDKDYLASRAAYKLGLTGPAVNVNTTCSTSLVAVHMACQSILSGECDMAIAGGSSVELPLSGGYLRQEGHIFSEDGHCRPFDARATGTVFGSGVGAVVLKSLAAAIDDGDTILAVVKGTAINNDGNDKVTFTAPSVNGQAAVIAEALGIAGVLPNEIGYVEAHGTATQLGDPIEVQALGKAFRSEHVSEQATALGAVKANVGHLNAAAGVAGLIKTVQALRHGEIPPCLHFTEPNPAIDFKSSPFYVPATARLWPESLHPRRAGVSSFGIGGTNAHAVLEQPPAEPARQPGRSLEILPLSAVDASGLGRIAQRLADWLEDPQASRVPLSDVAFSLAIGRKALPHRAAVVAVDHTAAARQLRSLTKNGLPASPITGSRPVAFLFPGQTIQVYRLAASLFDEPAFRETLATGRAVLTEAGRREMADWLISADHFAAAGNPMTDTAAAQPLMYILSVAIARTWTAWGITPGALLGHSLGEYSAACIAGVFPFEDGLRLLINRGRLVAGVEPGAMTSVVWPEDEARDYLAAPASARVELALINGPETCVFAGPEDEIARLESDLIERGVKFRRLPSNRAFHSASMDPILDSFRDHLSTMHLQAPKIPMLSNLTGDWLDAQQAVDPDYWCRHLREPVQFYAALRRLSGKGMIFLETGPGQAMTALAGQIAAEEDGPASTLIPSLPGAAKTDGDLIREFSSAFTGLWAAGAAIDWTVYFDKNRRRVTLPGYPFDRQRCWADLPDGIKASGAQPSPGHASKDEADAGGEIVPALDRDRILEILKSDFAALTGFDLTQLDTGMSFFDLGLDSLFIIQVGQVIKQRFSVSLSFRQLIEEFDSIDAIGAYLSDQITDVATEDVAEPVQSTEQPPAATVTDFGPFKPVGQRSDSTMNPRQQAHLDQLVATFNARTARSKRLVKDNSGLLADVRSSRDFRRPWKELCYPLTIERAQGATVWDADGHAYTDLVMGLGVCLFGHNPGFLREALAAAIAGEPQMAGSRDPLAYEASQRLTRLTGHERAAFFNTGSEAVSTALRLARAVTGRTKIVYFRSAYHGNFDSVLLSGRVVNGEPVTAAVTPGIPTALARDVVVLDYGEEASLSWIQTHLDELAAVLVEPVQSRNPHHFPREFLHALRDLTAQAGTALIFDEMITGFRVHPAGVQGLLGIRADMSTYGKIIGGGMPIGVVAGSARYLDAVDGGHWHFGDDSYPTAQQTFTAGTFCQHPLAMAGCCEVLRYLEEAGPALQKSLNETADDFCGQLNQVFFDRGIDARFNNFGSQFFFAPAQPMPFFELANYELLLRGVRLNLALPNFIGLAHEERDFQVVLAALDDSLAALQNAELIDRGETPVTSAARQGDTFPLTVAQKELWLTMQMDEAASRAYNTPLRWSLEGAWDSLAFEAGLERLIYRHEALRARFSADGESQTIADQATLPLIVIDLSGLAEPERRDTGERLALDTANLGFDMIDGSGLRVVLLDFGAGRGQIVFSASHLICDGWSLNVLFMEWAQLYRAAVSNAPSGLRPAASYRNQVLRNRTGGESARQAIEYWREQLSPPPELSDLPTDRPRHPQPRFLAGQIDRGLAESTAVTLRTFLREEQTSMFALLLAVHQFWLYRWSGQRDGLTAIFSAGQAAVTDGSLVGHFTAMLPVRTRANGCLSLRTWVRSVRALIAAAQENRHTTFGEMVQAVDFPRRAGRPPMLEVAFNTDRTGQGGGLPGLKDHVHDATRQFSFFDLFLNVNDRTDAVDLVLQFNRDLWFESTAVTWLTRYEQLLAGALANPDQPMGALPLMTADEQQTMLGVLNGPSGGWTFAPVTDAIAAQVAQTPDTIAVIDGPRHLTYRVLEAASVQAATRLTNQGLVPGDRVGLVGVWGRDYCAAVLGILRAGMVWVPLEPDQPVARLRERINVADPALIWVEQGTLDPDTVNGCTLPVQLTGRAAVPTATITATMPAYILFTSGSTGLPKGVVVSHGGIRHYCDWSRQAYGLKPGGWSVLQGNTAFDANLTTFLPPLMHGGSLLIAPAGQANDMLASLLQTGGSFDLIKLTPSQLAVLRQMLDHQPPRAKIACLVLGGERLDSALLADWWPSHEQMRVINEYGPTETVVGVTAHTLAGEETDASISIGQPIAGTRLAIMDRDGYPVPLGAPGELWIATPAAAIGYLQNPAQTAIRFVPDLTVSRAENAGGRIYRSGDWVRLDHSGRLQFLGRIDNQIKLRGHRIEPGEIEVTLTGFDQVRQAHVDLGTRFGQPGRLIAWITLDHPPEDEADFLGKLRMYLHGRMPEMMIPSAFVMLESFPLSSNGKLLKHALPEPEVIGLETAFEPPKQGLEMEVAGMWETVLAHQPIGRKGHFFALGGHSLLGAKLMAAIHRHFGIRLPLRTIFEAPTLEAFTTEIQVAQQAILANRERAKSSDTRPRKEITL